VCQRGDTVGGGRELSVESTPEKNPRLWTIDQLGTFVEEDLSKKTHLRAEKYRETGAEWI